MDDSQPLSYYHQVGKEPLKPLTIGLLLQQSSERYREKIAAISKHQNNQLTFNELLKQSDKFAAGLTKLGFQMGDRLGLWAPNLLEWIVTAMAAARLGLILVALNPFYKSGEMEYCINKVQIKGIVCARKHKEQDYYELLRKIAPELENSIKGNLRSSKVPSLKIVVVITTDEELKGAYTFTEVLNLADNTTIANISKQQHKIQMDEGCIIQFTSGTTGQPKATLLTHFNLVNNSYEIGRENEFGIKHHKICLQVPFFHAFGLNVGILIMLHYGLTLVLPSESYSPQKSLDAIVEEQCSCIYGTPTMFVDLINGQKRRKERIQPEIAVCGGAPASPHLYGEIKKILKIKTIKTLYGMTETSAASFQSLPGENDGLSSTTVGCLKQHLEAKVVDENGVMVPIGTVGELCIRGYSTFLGYWNDEIKTREIIGRDNWLKTGDQFVLLENGYGRIMGRYKEMIIRGGENIFPKEIEDVLNAHPEILESQVIGLPHERLGEEVCACIRVKEGAVVALENVVEFCKEKIARFKIPSQIKIVEEFPKTVSGKIQKFKLVQQFS